MEVTSDHRHSVIFSLTVGMNIKVSQGSGISFNLWNVLSFDRIGNILMV